VVSWIRLFKAAGFLAIILTNQRGIALGDGQSCVQSTIPTRSVRGWFANGDSLSTRA